MDDHDERRANRGLEALRLAGIPLPNGVTQIRQATYRTYTDDWHVQAENGDWFWWEARKRVWMPSFYGPTT